MSEPELERQVLVAGAGVAGLTLGGFLRKQGLDPVIIDRRDTDAGRQPGVLLWSNALAVFDALGVLDAVRTAGTPVDRVTTRAPDGTLVDTYEPSYGEARPFVGVSCARLRRLLRDRLPEGTIRPETTLDGVRAVDEGVEVRFSDRVHERFDAVVVDGTRPAIPDRAVDADRNDDGPTTWWVRVADGPETPDVVTELRDTDGPAFLFVPDPDGGTGVFTTRATADAPDVSPVEALRQAFDQFGWPLPAVLDAVEDGPHRYDAGRTLDQWTADRVALVGDAVHTTRPGSGLGASLAVESAVALIDELLTAPVDPAVRRYTDRRRDRVARVRNRTGTAAGAVTEPPLREAIRGFLSARDELLTAFFDRRRDALDGNRLDSV